MKSFPGLVLSGLVLSGLFLLGVVGCGGGGGDRFPQHTADAAAIAKQIMATYDTDANAELSPAELGKCKGLMMLTVGQEQLPPDQRLDNDGSGSVSEAELVQKFAACLKSRRHGYECVVYYRGQPLAGATVKLVPESFMGDVPVATGTTNDEGKCSVATDDGFVGGVPGIYKVEITHPTAKIGARFNTETTLSVALDPTNPYAVQGVPRIDVK
jgi:hypothetical protein